MSRLPPAPDPAIAPPRAIVLGFAVDALPREAALDRSTALISAPHAAHLVTGNALMIVECAENPALRAACESADLTLADSSGLIWAARWTRQPRLDRLPGVDLALELCRRAAAAGIPVFLLGGQPGMANLAADFLRRAIPGLRIGGLRDGYFPPSEEDAVIRDIKASGARLTLVAMGSPKQELWIYRLKARLPAGLYVGVGGTFDVWAGTVKRAPAWVQRIGFEWLFRLFQEPWRARRMAGLPIFAWRVLTQSGIGTESR